MRPRAYRIRDACVDFRDIVLIGDVQDVLGDFIRNTLLERYRLFDVSCQENLQIVLRVYGETMAPPSLQDNRLRAEVVVEYEETLLGIFVHGLHADRSRRQYAYAATVVALDVECLVPVEVAREDHAYVRHVEKGTFGLTDTRPH